MILCGLFFRGFWIVFLTATNVIQVTNHHYWGAFWVGLLISYTWWTNAYRVTLRVTPVRLAGLCYGLGGACGTVTGMAVWHWWYAL